MSDDKAPGAGRKDEEARRAQTIDLGKDAVKDMTPKPEPKAETKSAAATESGAATASAAAAASSSASAAPVPPRKPEERASSGLPVAAGAIAGAVFGLLGAVVYQNIQQPPVTIADPRVAQVEAAIAAVEKKTVEAGQIEQRLSAQLKAVEARAATVEKSADQIAQKATVLEQKSAQLEQKAAAVDQKASMVEQRAAGFEAKAVTIVSPVDDRLKAAEARLSEARDQAAALGKRVDLLAQIEAPKVDLRPIVGKVEELERAIGSNAARVTLSSETALALDGRIKGVETSVKGVEASVADLKARRPVVDASSAVLAIVGLARHALDSGEPIGNLTTAMAALGVAEPVLQGLAPYAKAAAPRPAQLADQYADLAAKLPKPTPPAPPKSDSLVERVTSGLWSQVDVRKVGAAAAPDATGIAAIVRQRLQVGDLSGALEPIKALPQDQQAGLKSFIDAVAARVAATVALRRIEIDALASATRKG